MAYKLEKLQELIHHEVASILQRDFFFPGAMVTVTRVETSSDRQHAAVYVGVFPQSERKKIAAMLRKVVYPIQQALNRRLRMRPVPKLRFVVDISEERADRIRNILRSLHDTPSART